jgi:hypothetical protein
VPWQAGARPLMSNFKHHKGTQVTSSELELYAPPQEERAFELWLQHAAGKVLFEDVRAYAMRRVDPHLSSEARSAAETAINDAVYGLMMVIDGVSGSLRNDIHSVELSMIARLIDCKDRKVLAQIDLQEGDGMCIGYHGWLQGDYGENPITSSRHDTQP